ncbi:MAG: hypothetical protein AB8B74_13360 [Crocinitomicaceae bacterium]
MKVKKVVLILSVISISSLTSCSKDYTCECDGSKAGLANQTYTITSSDESEAKATYDGYADNTGGLVVCTLN